MKKVYINPRTFVTFVNAATSVMLLSSPTAPEPGKVPSHDSGAAGHTM